MGHGQMTVWKLAQRFIDEDIDNKFFMIPIILSVTRKLLQCSLLVLIENIELVENISGMFPLLFIYSDMFSIFKC